MLGLLVYAVLFSRIQLHVVNCDLGNETQPYVNTAGTSASTTVQPSTTTKLSLSTSTYHGTSAKTPQQPQFCQLFKDGDCILVLITGGLIIACTVLILSTLILAGKVCLLSKRLSALSSNVDLSSHTGHTREANVKESSLWENELKEGSMLMGDRLQEDGTEEAAAEKVEDASPASAEDSSHPAPQGEPSEGGEKDEKDVV
eukprot:XP_011609777.1 PREDICTED: uncharacterized protein LOC105417481 [Takifugu rubripes]